MVIHTFTYLYRSHYFTVVDPELLLHLVLLPVLELALVDALEQLISLVLEGALGKSSVKTLGRSTRGEEVARS